MRARVISFRISNSQSDYQNRQFCLVLGAMLFALCSFAEARQAKVYRVGVIHQGGPYKAVVDGLRDGLKQLGYEEGKHFLLEIRDTKGDPKARRGGREEFRTGKSQLDIRGYHVCRHSGQECYLEESLLFSPSAATRSPADSCRALGNLAGDSQAFSTRPRISRGSGSRS